MQDSMQMAVRDAAAELVQKGADGSKLQPAFRAVRKFLQVEVQKLKDECQLLVRMNDIVQSGAAKVLVAGVVWTSPL